MNKNSDKYCFEEMGCKELVEILQIKEETLEVRKKIIKNLKIARNFQALASGIWVLNIANFTYRVINKTSTSSVIINSVALTVGIANVAFNAYLCRETQRKTKAKERELKEHTEEIEVCKNLIKQFNCHN